MDKRRALYYNTNTQHRWGAKESYHLMIDSGTLGQNAAIAVIEACVKLLEEKKHHPM